MKELRSLLEISFDQGHDVCQEEVIKQLKGIRDDSGDPDEIVTALEIYIKENDPIIAVRTK